MLATDPDRPQVEDVMREWGERANRAVIFDFNGTLSDDEPILLSIFTDLFSRYLGWQMSPQEYAERLLGHSDREIVEIAVREHRGDKPGLVEELLARRRDRYKELVAARSPITDSAAELVAHLARREVPMAIVTGAQREDVLAVLNSCSTGDHIDLLVAEEDVERGKPDPEGFLAGAALLGVEPGDVLVFEDSVPGIRGALAAGMRCVAVTGDDPQPRVLAAGVATTRRLSADLLDR
ncbi:MAG: HAD family phosphatase [Mycetocola sp.]